jgi:FkbM family methyltransferase
LIYADYPEFVELRFIRSFLKRGDIVIDVGANVGHIGLLLSDIVEPTDIYAFEPTPITYARLRENWKKNEFSVDHLYNAAVGSQCGEALIRNVSHPDLMNALVSCATQNDAMLIKVPLFTLDSIRDKWFERRIGLIKIDVEGFEGEVFHGARTTLREDRPSLVMFESLGGALESRIASELRDAEYLVFQLDSDGHPDFTRATAQNLFAVAIERRATIVGD